MIGVNDWGILPNPGSVGRRPIGVHIEQNDNEVEPDHIPITKDIVSLLEYTWALAGHDKTPPW